MNVIYRIVLSGVRINQSKRTAMKSNMKRMVAIRKMSTAWVLLLALCAGCTKESNVDWNEIRHDNLQCDLAIIYSDIEAPDHPLTLEEIYEIASQRNLNLLVKQQEYAIQRELVTREKWGMLADLRMHFEEFYRNKNTGSSSQSLVPGVPPAPLSISSQQHQKRWDAQFVWNYLDFGLSFYRSRQEFDRSVKLNLEYERQRQNLYVDLTKEYWKAIAARWANSKSKVLVEKAEKQQENIRKEMAAKVVSEIQGLRGETQLVTFRSQVQAYEKEYHAAKSELGLLMGLPPGITFELAEVDHFPVDIEFEDIKVMEWIALKNRPELYSSDAEERIQQDEARAALLQMFPGVEFFSGNFFDENRFLLFNRWLQAGVRATWNLLDYPRHYFDMKVADGRQDLARRNRVLMSITVMSQVNLARNIYQDNLDTYKLNKELSSINERLLKAVKNEQKEGKLHEADVLKYEIEKLQVEIDLIKSYGELQNALEQINNALGIPFYYKHIIEGQEDENTEHPAEAPKEAPEYSKVPVEKIEEKAGESDQPAEQPQVLPLVQPVEELKVLPVEQNTPQKQDQKDQPVLQPTQTVPAATKNTYGYSSTTVQEDDSDEEGNVDDDLADEDDSDDDDFADDDEGFDDDYDLADDDDFDEEDYL